MIVIILAAITVLLVVAEVVRTLIAVNKKGTISNKFTCADKVIITLIVISAFIEATLVVITELTDIKIL